MSSLNHLITDESENGPAALRAKYDVGRVIGEGNFAVVKECMDRWVEVIQKRIKDLIIWDNVM